MRETVQRKMCVMVFGIKEKNLPMKMAREKEEVKRAKEIIAEVAGEGEKIVEQIEEVYRIGKYNENGTRPMKIRFMSQTAVEHLLQRYAFALNWAWFELVYIFPSFSLISKCLQKLQKKRR